MIITNRDKSTIVFYPFAKQFPIEYEMVENKPFIKINGIDTFSTLLSLKIGNVLFVTRKILPLPNGGNDEVSITVTKDRFLKTIYQIRSYMDIESEYHDQINEFTITINNDGSIKVDGGKKPDDV